MHVWAKKEIVKPLADKLWKIKEKKYKSVYMMAYDIGTNCTTLSTMLNKNIATERTVNLCELFLEGLKDELF